jgi:hypothetical protein
MKADKVCQWWLLLVRVAYCSSIGGGCAIRSRHVIDKAASVPVQGAKSWPSYTSYTGQNTGTRNVPTRKDHNISGIPNLQ